MKTRQKKTTYESVREKKRNWEQTWQKWVRSQRTNIEYRKIQLWLRRFIFTTFLPCEYSFYNRNSSILYLYHWLTNSMEHSHWEAKSLNWSVNSLLWNQRSITLFTRAHHWTLSWSISQPDIPFL
jgi:hypothetical protein